jgi:hypothetical protein
MKHLLGIIVFLSLAYAQENYISVNFQLHSNQVLADSDIVYIAGSFNNWHPGDRLYAMHKAGDKYELELRLPRNSMFEYKFTLGSWEKVEINENFEDTPNRITISKIHKVFTFFAKQKDVPGCWPVNLAYLALDRLLTLFLCRDYLYWNK